jgi:glycosyltransferase involved in cell wall biosynthesis
LLFFLSHPIQYVSPLLRELSAYNKLTVYYYGGQSAVNLDSGFGQKVTWDIPLLDGYEHVFLNNSSCRNGMNTRFFDAINWSIFRLLRKSEDNVVILNGWAYLSDWIVLFSARLYGKKVWMRAEMPWNQEALKVNSIKKSMKYFIFKYLVFKYLIDNFLYIGSQNKQYYLMHGVKESKLIFAPYSVDNQRFQGLKTDGKITRKMWGVDEKQIVILFSGKLINKKRPLDLLRAFHRLNNANVTLFYMGDGPLRQDLEDFIKIHGIDHVIISGFINQSEIASIYSMGDIFVMCSGLGETWGLSVNEAMNFGLPVVVSATCGSSFDLVENGKNGYIFREGDTNSLSSILEELVENPEKRESMGSASRVKINEFSHEVTRQNISKFLNKSLANN